MEVEDKTIIITDPCYIVKDDKDWDKSDWGYEMSALGLTNSIVTDTKYGDWSCKTLKGSDIEDVRNIWNSKYFDFWNKYNFSELTDEEKSKLLDEFNQFSKEYDKKYCLGNFCADAGLVGVFILDEVLTYNPNFNYHIDKPWTTTVIQNFTGTIKFNEVKISETEFEVRVIGRGNIDFTTTQTGF